MVNADAVALEFVSAHEQTDRDKGDVRRINVQDQQESVLAELAAVRAETVA